MSKNKNQSGGISFAGMLAILFIALKLMNYIDWSWWWVLSPLWIPAVIVLGVCVTLLAFAGLCWLVALILDKSDKTI